MPTTNFVYADIDKGFFGECAVDATTIVLRPLKSCWAGWITGTDATWKCTAGGTIPYAVTVDGRPVVFPTISGGVISLFAGLDDEPHWVQIQNRIGDNGIVTFSTFVLAVTGAAPALECFGDKSVTWVTGDSAFPAAILCPRVEQDLRPWQPNTIYDYQQYVTNGGNTYRMNTVPAGGPGFSGNSGGPTGTDAQIGGDGSCVWDYIASPPAANTFKTTTPSAVVGRLIVAQPHASVIKVKIKAEELWVFGYGGQPITDGAQNRVTVKSAKVGVAFTHTMTRAFGSVTSWADSTALPDGLTRSSGGVGSIISGTPTTAGTYTWTITGSHASGDCWETFILDIAPAAGMPAITSVRRAVGVAGTPFRYQIIATDSPTSYAASGLPAGLSIDAATGIITGTPAAAGAVNIDLTATNGSGSGTTVLRLNVTAAGAPTFPELAQGRGLVATLYCQAAKIGLPFEYQILATGAPTAFSTTSLPTGLSLDTTTGKITGTPTVAGNNTVTITATNAGGTSTASLVIRVTAVGGPIILSSIPGGALWISANNEVPHDAMTVPGDGANLIPGGVNCNGATAGAAGTLYAFWYRVLGGLDPARETTVTLVHNTGDGGLEYGIAARNPSGGTPQFLPLQYQARNVGFGDSIMAGAQSPNTESLQVSSKFGVSYSNSAISGEVIWDIIARINRCVIAYDGGRLDALVFGIGFNEGPARDQAPSETVVSAAQRYRNGDFEYIVTASGTTGAGTPPTGLSLATNAITDGTAKYQSNMVGLKGAPWVAGTYEVGTQVQNGTDIYQCDTAGTSVTGPTGNAGAASAISDGGTARWSAKTGPAWAAATFVAGDVVHNNGQYFRCTTGGTSVLGPNGINRLSLGYASVSGLVKDGGTAVWECVTSPFCWGASTRYEVGQVRVNGNAVYVCDTAGTSAASGGPTGTTTAEDSITDGTVGWHYTPWHVQARYEVLLRLALKLNLARRFLLRPVYPGLAAANTFDPWLRAAWLAINDPRITYIDPKWGEGLSPDWNQPDVQGDGTHPSAYGYNLIGKLIERDYRPFMLGGTVRGLAD